MVGITRTMNPIHFEDLDPKRFEDLVRQLIYDFKSWRKLEATGRSGSDDGFDARGLEAVAPADARGEPEDGDERDERQSGEAMADRLWLVQCKRENRIGPARMRKHLREIRLGDSEKLYGVIFAAACDFSKKTREVLAEWCRENGVSEWHLWGRGELEDKLLQPKNDSLLFAYFGVSLAIRRKSKVSEVRRDIATKRKLNRILDDYHGRTLLLRDIEDDRYPFAEHDNSHRWRVRQVVKVISQGLVINRLMQQAWISADRSAWDAAFGSPGMRLDNGEDIWLTEPEEATRRHSLASDTWRAFADEEKAWAHTEILIPFEKIVLIDDDGDDQFQGPHLYIANWNDGLRGRRWLSPMNREREFRLDDGDIEGMERRSIFPEDLRLGSRIPRI